MGKKIEPTKEQKQRFAEALRLLKINDYKRLYLQALEKGLATSKTGKLDQDQVNDILTKKVKKLAKESPEEAGMITEAAHLFMANLMEVINRANEKQQKK